MMLRVRHPGKPAADVDLGPCPEVRSSLGGSVQAAPVGYMAPVILGTVHSGMSDGHGTPKVQAFSIRPENGLTPSQLRYVRISPRPEGTFVRLELAPRCGYLMPKAQEPCARVVGHSLKGWGHGHRTRRDLDRRAERKRENYPPGRAA